MFDCMNTPNTADVLNVDPCSVAHQVHSESSQLHVEQGLSQLSVNLY